MPVITKVTLSSKSRLNNYCLRFDFQEAYLVAKLSPSSRPLKGRVESAWKDLPIFLNCLFKFKNLVFVPFGFRAVTAEYFRILDEKDDLLVVDFLDRHFHSCIALTIDPHQSTLLFENRVEFLSPIGKTYLNFFKVPHELIIKTILKRL